MKRTKRVGTIIMAIALMLSMPGVAVYAEEIPEQEETTQEETVQESTIQEEIAQETPEPGQDEEDQQSSTSNESNANEESTPAGEAPEASQTAGSAISYVYVDEKTVNVPEVQNIVVGFADENIQIASAALNCSTLTGNTYQIAAANIVANSVLFSRNYSEAENDTIYIDSITYQLSGSDAETTLALADLKIDAEYTVTTDAEMDTVAEGEEGTPSITAYALDESGAMTEISGEDTDIESTIESVVDATGVETPDRQSKEISVMSEDDTVSTQAGNVVVALAAGHDNNHAGAQANGLIEAQLTLKVAQYCKAELEQYAGVSVYMVRNSMDCPYNTGIASSCNTQRIAGAAAAGAKYYVDIHFNSGGGAGAEVYYPNVSYNSTIHQQGYNLANSILAQLSALGLSNRGAKIRDCTTGETDPNGNLEDYYTTNNVCKRYGMTGIIVEHAFIDNAGDAAKLKNESFLQQLGIADASGIANALGLYKQPTIEIVNKNDYLHTFDIEYSGMASGGQNGATITVWQKDNFNTTKKQYKVSGTNGKISINTADFKNMTGTYCIDVWNYANNKYLVGTSCRVSSDTSSSTKLVEKEKEKTYTATMTFANMPDEVSKVEFLTWGSAGGQNDLVSHAAKKTSATTWAVDIPVSAHKETGLYYVDAYVTLANGYQKYIDSNTFQISKLSGKISVSNYNKEKGTFDVSISNIVSPSGISKVQIPVWCASNQSDLHWYTATAQSDGSYKTTVSTANHKYAVGNYYVDGYVTAKNGVTQYVGSARQQIALPNVDFSIEDSGTTKETTYLIKTTNLAMVGAVKAQYAVWSESNGQDDLKWYAATKGSTGEWTATVPVSNHKTTGKYFVHTYITLSNGTSKYVCGGTFSVTKPTASLKVSNYDEKAGTFVVTISKVSSASGISKIRVPVWCAANQSDLHWYDAIKQTDGTYKVTVSTANHKYAVGTYYVDCYLNAINGINQYVGGARQTVKLLGVTIKATAQDKSEKTYKVETTNLSSVGAVSAKYAVWSAVKGQDDLKWYTAQKNNEGVWVSSIPVSAHKTPGKYYVDCYITTAQGANKYVCGTSFDVTTPAGNISITNYQQSKGTFDIIVKDVISPAGVSSIKIPVWCATNQSDLYWYEATKQSDGTYKTTVDFSKHNYAVGNYYIDVYLLAGNGINQYIGGARYQVKNPGVSIAAKDTNGKENSFKITASNLSLLDAVSARFAVWCETGGQDDLVWYSATKNTSGEWTTTVPISKHKQAGKYDVHAYITLANGTTKFACSTTFTVSRPSATVKTSNYNSTTGEFDVIVSKVDSVSGISGVAVPVWCAANQSDLHWYAAVKQADGTYKFSVKPSSHHDNSGIYKIDVYVQCSNGVTQYTCGTTQSVTVPGYYAIMGNSTTTVAQMVKYYNANATYPKAIMTAGGAPNIETFCQIYYEECQVEGVKAEVAFCQAMKETGWLKYGGQVLPNQYNFAGLGATDDGAKGATFADVRTGVRAQIQHLVAYASTGPIHYGCVDPRYNLVTRGCAPFVEWLGTHENPNGYGWATGMDYGPSIVRMINALKTY